MKKLVFFVMTLIIAEFLFGQEISKKYSSLIAKGRNYYFTKDYKNAAITFSDAVQLAGNKTPFIDRHRAAFSWALAGYPDSTFYYLNTIADMPLITFKDYVWLITDEDYASIINDPRWKSATDKIFENARKFFYTLYTMLEPQFINQEIYHAAVAWAVKKSYDSTFYYLNRIALSKELTFNDANMVFEDDVLKSLENEKRWQEFRNLLFYHLNQKYLSSSSFNKKSVAKKRILIDGAHYNLHDINGTYKIIAGTLAQSGFKVEGITEKFTAHNLQHADILLISNPHTDHLDSLSARAKRAGEPLRWSAVAAQSAFNESEINAVANWVKKGGSLLLILDHAPMGKTGGMLAAAFGIECRNVSTYAPLTRDPIVTDTNMVKSIIFTRSKGLLGNHPILQGIDSITTYTGESLMGPSNSQVLLYLPETAYDVDWLPETKEYRNRTAAGRSRDWH